jgi:hypothetical protein
MAPVPYYPDFVPMSLELKNILHPRLSLTADGISEFTFSGLYLFRNRYHYRISRTGQNGGFIISGGEPRISDARPVASAEGTGAEHQGKFFMTPCEAPSNDTLFSLFSTHDYWKNISETVLEASRQRFTQWGINVNDDRNNYDYLYKRNDLAQLPGKKYHKKKNLIKQFLNTYTCEQRVMTRELVPQAMEILEQWRQDKGTDGDYSAAREALELYDYLALRGYIFFADGKPAAFCLGESIAKGKMFAVHFEKAIDSYKGIYQFMNQAFAAALPGFFIYINREQDLGDEGLRQAKMTYRPSGFVKKYSARLQYAGEKPWII